MPLTPSEIKLKNYLIEKELLPLDQVAAIEEEIDRKGKNLEKILVDSGKISSSEFNQIKAELFRVEAANLAELIVDSQTLNLLNRKVAKNYLAVIFNRQGDKVKVGLVDPGNFQVHEAIDFWANQQDLEPEYHSISLADFKHVFDQYGTDEEEIDSAFESAKSKFTEKKEQLSNYQLGGDLEQVISKAPVAKIVSVIIRNAMDGGASDIHIEPDRSGGRVRYRVDGQLSNSLNLPAYIYNAVVSRIKVMANLKLDESRLPQDGRIRVNIDGREADLRVSVLPMLDHEKVVMRLLDTSAGVPTLTELGFLPHHIEIINRNIKKPFGLFLLTGPTGSGKTTTLYAILNILDSAKNNIVTLEDPIEYYVEGVNQSQINPDIGYSFASGLRAILRQDPNIIMVGEIRDNETVELTIHASLTGHLVFSTLHTNNAWGAIPRLIDMKAEPFLLASTLNLVMAQRLVRKICPHCKVAEELTSETQKKMEKEISKIPQHFLSDIASPGFFKGQGCDRCGNSGYIGRTVAVEILEVTPELKNLISDNFSYGQIEEQLTKQKHINLIQDVIIKALKGITSVEEVLRVSQDQ